MKIRALWVLLLGVVCGVTPAAAQLSGIPYGPAPSGTGVVLSADYGSPESGSAWGLGGGMGFGRFGASVAFGNRDFEGPGDATTFGGIGGMQLTSLGPVGIGAQFGLGTLDSDDETSTALLPGVSGTFNLTGIPLKPWAVVYYALLEDVDDELRGTIGADFNFLPTLGVHGAVDMGDSETVWGLGAHFRFGV